VEHALAQVDFDGGCRQIGLAEINPAVRAAALIAFLGMGRRQASKHDGGKGPHAARSAGNENSYTRHTLLL
jgi:hypothetical protein